MTQRVVDVDGIRLAYSDEGTGDGARTILLIHGHPFDRTMWAPQLQFLRSDFRIIAPDLRGYGKSSLPNGCRVTTLDAFAHDCLGLLDALDVRDVIVVGLSMGGQIALELHRQAPERVAALVLADTFAGLDSEATRQLRLTTADRLERDGMSEYAAEVLTKMITPANARAFPSVAARVMQMMSTTPPSGAAAALRGRAQRIDYLPLLATIRVPTLVLVGREDEYTPIVDAVQLQRGIRGSKLVIIDDAGHLPNLERASAFNAILGTWLQDRCGASAIP